MRSENSQYCQATANTEPIYPSHIRRNYKKKTFLYTNKTFIISDYKEVKKNKVAQSYAYTDRYRTEKVIIFHVEKYNVTFWIQEISTRHI